MNIYRYVHYIYIYMQMHMNVLKFIIYDCLSMIGDTLIHTFIIILITFCTQHGFPWFSFYIHPYHLLLSVSRQSYILCPHRADVSKFLLISQHWSVCVCKSPKENIFLWVCPYFSILMECFMWCCFKECCFDDLFKIAYNDFV